jgi:hypothetical protein
MIGASMVRKADSREFSEAKKAAAQTFIYYVEKGRRDATLAKITDDLMRDEESEADEASDVRRWCRYRKGGGAWPLHKLKEFVERAIKCKYITAREATDLNSRITFAQQIHDYEKFNHKLNQKNSLCIRFSADIFQSVETLRQQILQLAGRVDYGIEELEKAHFYTTALESLKDIRMLIEDLQSAKREEERLLKIKYGKRNYKEIAHGRAENEFLSDVKYSSAWWEIPMQTNKVPNTKSEKFRLEIRKELQSIRKKMDTKKLISN